jgi:hypothetical protein
MRPIGVATVVLIWIGLALGFANSLSAQGAQHNKSSSAGQAMQSPDSDHDAFGDENIDRDGPDERQPFAPPDRGGSPGRNPPPGPPTGPLGQESMEDMPSLKANNPELYRLIKQESDLDRRIFTTAAKYRRASREQRERIKEELQKLVAQQFDVSQQRRESELKYRDKAKQQLIEKRVSSLLSQENGDRRGPRRPDMGRPQGDDMPPPRE